VLVFTPGVGLAGNDWLWVVLGLVLDISHYAAAAARRKDIPGYPGP
jgi:hypothetical protein